MEGTLMPLLFGALMALVCFCIGISKGYSALWSAVAGFFGHVIAAAILLLLPDREHGRRRRNGGGMPKSRRSPS